MPRTQQQYEWLGVPAFRAGVIAECHRRFLALFGEPCTHSWLDGWRGLITRLVDQDTRARELRHNGSVHRAAEFLREQGASPGAPATVDVTAHTLELMSEVTQALADRTSTLRSVRELPREMPKLTESHLEAVVLLFESHSDRDGKARWLTDRELAVVSLLLREDRVWFHSKAKDKATSLGSPPVIRSAPRAAIDHEARKIKEARRKSGDLQTPADERWHVMGPAKGRPKPVLKRAPDLGFATNQQAGLKLEPPKPSA